MRNFIVTPDGNQTSFKYPDDREIELGTLIDLFTMRDENEIKTTYKVSLINKASKAIYFHVVPHIVA